MSLKGIETPIPREAGWWLVPEVFMSLKGIETLDKILFHRLYFQVGFYVPRRD